MLIPSPQKIKRLPSSRSIFISLSFSLLTLGLGLAIGKKGLRGPWRFLTGRINYLKTTTYHRFFTPAPDKINLNISFKNLEKIKKKRQQALKQGVLIASDSDFVSAEIEHQGKKIPVKIRLKGDWTDHLKGKKWSFRIHTKNNQAFLGMRRFSIQDPATRNNASEWIFLQALKKEGLIALRYQLVNVSINGENKGIFALEEHFSKELLENNKRREAPILKFSEDQFWLNGLSYGFTPESSADLFYHSSIEPFRKTKTLENQKLSSQFRQAEYLLRQYRSGSLSAEKVFDIDQWTTLFALSDVFGVRHGLVWHNLRFYLNPLTGLIEPIAFDSNPGERITYLSLNAPSEDYQLTQILRNPAFQKKYIQNLKKFSQKKYLSDFLNSIGQDLKRFTQIINRERPYSPPLNIYYANQEFIKKKLTHTPALLAFASQDRTLKIISTQKLPLEIGNRVLQPLSSLTIPITGSTPSAITYRFLGLTQEYQAPLQSWTAQINSTGLSQKSPLPTFTQLDQANQRLVIPPGNWTLFRNLVVPQNFSLYIAPGANINLKQKAYIISHSPIYLQGTIDQPIKIYSSDQTGQGILVLNTSQISTISHTVFKNLAYINVPGNNITGSVTFYNSPVNIQDSLFSNNHAEDSLNLVRSRFKITNSSFYDSSGDALDIDFSHGKIKNSTFINSGNDAIDLSASTAAIDNVSIDQAGDKGISAGESSLITITNTNIKNTYTGIASKDLSQVNTKLISIQDSTFGLAVYQKKPEYGPGYISSWGSVITGTATPFLIEENSKLIQNDAEQSSNSQNVYQTHYAN